MEEFPDLNIEATQCMISNGALNVWENPDTINRGMEKGEEEKGCQLQHCSVVTFGLTLRLRK